MAKRNRLVSDVRKAAAQAKAALANTGRIGESVDQWHLIDALSYLKNAADALDAAADYFERHGRDYLTADELASVGGGR